MTVQYAILCHARTGSNYLVQALAQQPQITAHNELFHERAVYRADTTLSADPVLKRRDANPIAYLQQTLNNPATPVTGFKHLLFYNETITDYVLSGEMRLILLERENVLAQYSSLKIAHQTGQWTLKPGQKAAAVQPVPWDEADFAAYCQQYQTAYQRLRERLAERSAPGLHIYYRDLFTAAQIQRVLAFLGIDAETSPRVESGDMIQQQNTSHITERFTESQTVREYLTHSGRTGWTHETKVSDS
jgi:LPS sulfotransferase NodH